MSATCAHVCPQVQLRVVASSGDAPAVAGAPLRALGPGAFTKELDAQVAAGEADGAVHSLKDAPPVRGWRCALPLRSWHHHGMCLS